MPRSKLIFALLMAGIGVAAAVSLGNWQTRRAQEKATARTQADTAMRSLPLEIPAATEALQRVGAELPRNVRLSGVFDPAGTVYLDNRMLGGVVGYYVITPLVLAEGVPAVLVDRGFKARNAGEAPDIPGTPQGRVVIEGLAVARPSALFELAGAPSLQVPGTWQNLDYDAYERITKRSVARFVVRQANVGRPNVSDGLRHEWPSPSSGEERNRAYAFQWYALAALITVLACYFGYRSWRAR